MKQFLRLSFVLMIWVAESSAGVPLLISQGHVARWDSQRPIRYKVDDGNLGSFDHASALQLLNSALSVWQSVPTSNVAFVNAGSIGYDVNLASWNSFQAQNETDPEFSPIVFDNDGLLVELYYGTGASNTVLGFAGPKNVQEETGGIRITSGWAVLNGKLAQHGAGQQQLWRDTLAHELGHFLNLSHSPANLSLGQDNDLANNVHIPIMSPVAWQRPLGWQGLTGDDIAIISSLYPENNFRETTGTLSGQVTLSDGSTLFKGAHVAAIRLDGNQQLTRQVYSGISGFLDADGTQPERRGYFEISGLPAGQYALLVEGLDSRWAWVVSGPDLPAPAEFFNSDESGSDDVARFSPITVTVGQVASGVDVALNTGPVYRYLSILPLSDDRNEWITTLGINNLSKRSSRVSIEFHYPDGRLGGLSSVTLAGSALSLRHDVNRWLTGKSATLGYLVLRSTQPTTAWISLAAPTTRDPQIMNSTDIDTGSETPKTGFGSRMVVPFTTKMEEWQTHLSMLNLGESTSVKVTYLGENGAALAENSYAVAKNEMIYLQDIVAAVPNVYGHLSIEATDDKAQLVVRGLLAKGNQFGSILNPILLP